MPLVIRVSMSCPHVVPTLRALEYLPVPGCNRLLLCHLISPDVPIGVTGVCPNESPPYKTQKALSHTHLLLSRTALVSGLFPLNTYTQSLTRSTPLLVLSSPRPPSTYHTPLPRTNTHTRTHTDTFIHELWLKESPIAELR